MTKNPYLLGTGKGLKGEFSKLNIPSFKRKVKDVLRNANTEIEIYGYYIRFPKDVICISV